MVRTSGDWSQQPFPLFGFLLCLAQEAGVRPRSVSGENAPLLGFSDMKGALGFSGVFLFLLSAATVGVTGQTAKTVRLTGQTAAPATGSYCAWLKGFCHNTAGAITMDCLLQLMEYICLNTFKIEMEKRNSTDWCTWGNVNSLYSNLSICTENISDCLEIPWPNPLVEEIFMDVHATYFHECPTEEFSDPPPATIFALVITPICLIPVMVSVVVLKTKNADGNS